MIFNADSPLRFIFIVVENEPIQECITKTNNRQGTGEAKTERRGVGGTPRFISTIAAT
jgi:hypothetical protein